MYGIGFEKLRGIGFADAQGYEPGSHERCIQRKWLRFINHLVFRGFFMAATIADRVKKIVIDQLGVKEDAITNSSSFVEDLGADSLDTVELVMALEEEFGIEIQDEEAEKITTIQQAIDFIEKQKEKVA